MNGMDDLDKKLNASFDGKVLRKDLLHLLGLSRGKEAAFEILINEDELTREDILTRYEVERWTQ